MEGIFVYTESGKTVTFTKSSGSGAKGTTGSKDDNIVINLNDTKGTVIDRAIVRFDEGETLPKFQLRENSTKIYIPQGEKDYAIVNAGNSNEMPLNLKVSSNGKYTLSVNPGKRETGYLHLIDNLTGADVDLLNGASTGSATSYTFSAKTTDYESRFKLVFSPEGDGLSTGSGTFAFINDGNIIVNAGPSTHSTGSGTTGSGTSILQVFDILGRQHFAKELSTVNYQLSTANFPSGVYVLRLINGENVRTQKIVVK